MLPDSGMFPLAQSLAARTAVGVRRLVQGWVPGDGACVMVPDDGACVMVPGDGAG